MTMKFFHWGLGMQLQLSRPPNARRSLKQPIWGLAIEFTSLVISREGFRHRSTFPRLEPDAKLPRQQQKEEGPF